MNRGEFRERYVALPMSGHQTRRLQTLYLNPRALAHGLLHLDLDGSVVDIPADQYLPSDGRRCDRS